MYFDELSQVAKLLNEYNLNLNTYHNRFLNKSHKKAELILPHLLKRYYGNFTAINILIFEFWKGNYRLETSIGILLRSILHDSMLVMYITSPHYLNDAKNEDKINKELN